MLLVTIALIIASAGPVPSSSRINFVDIRQACDAQTSVHNKRTVKSMSPDPADQESACLDEATGVSALAIESVDLGHNKVTDGYALRLHIDPSRTKELRDFSIHAMGKELVIVKGDAYVFRARIYAPMDQGLVLLLVPNKDAGVKLAKILFPEVKSSP